MRGAEVRGHGPVKTGDNTALIECLARRLGVLDPAPMVGRQGADWPAGASGMGVAFERPIGRQPKNRRD
jgi:hypothetical protein